MDPMGKKQDAAITFSKICFQTSADQIPMFPPRIDGIPLQQLEHTGNTRSNSSNTNIFPLCSNLFWK